MTSDSIALRFTARQSTRSQRSQIERNGPLSSLAAMIASTAADPTFFTASSPKRIVPRVAGRSACGAVDSPGETAKSCPDSFTSGGSTSMPISSQRETKKGTLSLVCMTDEISAAMYSAGWFALSHAVRYAMRA